MCHAHKCIDLVAQSAGRLFLGCDDHARNIHVAHFPAAPPVHIHRVGGPVRCPNQACDLSSGRHVPLPARGSCTTCPCHRGRVQEKDRRPPPHDYRAAVAVPICAHHDQWPCQHVAPHGTTVLLHLQLPTHSARHCQHHCWPCRIHDAQWTRAPGRMLCQHRGYARGWHHHWLRAKAEFLLQAAI
jgi:hypothetical protein